MKLLIGVLLFVLSFIFIEFSMAQSLAPSPAASIVAVISNAPASSGIWGFIKSNLSSILFVLWLIGDALIYFIPSLKANGIFQQVMMWLGKESGQVPPSGS